MGTITVILEDSIDQRMRDYIDKTWSKRHGKITQVIEEALELFLSSKES
jgi:hypothetical protein